MAIKNYNIPPYYDDFDPAKNYVRILFRPGYAVQARELTQLQTALQAQIDRFGSHVFKEGSPVIGGQTSIDNAYEYVRLESTFDDPVNTTNYPEGDGSNIAPYYTTAVDQIIEGATSKVKALVVEAVHSTSTDPLTLFVRYLKASTSGTAHTFTDGEIITYTVAGIGEKKFKVKTPSQQDNIASCGRGTRVSVNEGVYFVKGNFVYAEQQSIIVSKYTSNPSARVIYKISENIVTSAEDSTLVDNSIGTPNESAPGAHRYQIALDLVVEPYSLAARTEENLIQLLLISGGQITGRARTEYSELARTLATRTYEESGNYTVRPFKINIREYYNNGTNNGLKTIPQIYAENPSIASYTEAQAIAYGKSKLAIGLEPSVAYVSGYRVETLDTSYVIADKARDTDTINQSSIFCPLGGYVYVRDIQGVPDITTFSSVNLKNSSASTIGTARVRAIKYAGTAIASVNGSDISKVFYKLYLFDIVMNSGASISSVASVDQAVPTAFPGSDFIAVVDDINKQVVETVLYDPSNSSLIYKLPVNAVKSTRSLLNSQTTDAIYYTFTKKLLNNVSGTSIQLSGSANVTFWSTDKTDYIISDNSGNILIPSVDPVLSGNQQQVTLTFGTTLSGTYYVIAPTVKKNLTEKSKTLQSGATTSVANPNTNAGGYDSIGYADVFRLVGVYMSANLNTIATVSDTDITDRYILDNGQRENFYDIGRIQLKPGATAPTGQILIKFDYLNHSSSGDYFTADSYAGISYEDIPTFNSIKGTIFLRDAIDFRPRKSNNGTGFTDTGSSVSECVSPDSIFFTDIEHYTPRIDKVYVNKNGDFGVVKGISGVSPKTPDDPEDAMILYSIALGAYTFDSTDLIAKMVDNKRYTMRDIGRLEKRVANVEYYTSLSLLEKYAANSQILDKDGQQRYKNGFLVDSFVDHNIGAVTHPDYRCSIEAEKGVLRPEFVQKYINLIPDFTPSSGSTNVKQTGSLITLDYQEVSLIEQPYSSYAEFVNPHEVYGWQGRLELSPASDDWKETAVAPSVAANASQSYNWRYDASTTTQQNGVYNNWQVEWYGVSPEEEEELTSQVRESGVFGSLKPGQSTSVSATTTNGETVEGTAKNIGRYISTGVFSGNQSSQVGDAIVNNTVVPYIRSRKIYFTATGLKANSRVYPFFDGIDISNYTRTEASMRNYTTNPDDKDYSGLTSHDAGISANLITSENGTLIGSFIIPNNNSLRFKTGERTFRLIDNQINNVNAAFTYADITYRATGIFVPAPTPAPVPPSPTPTPKPTPAILIAPVVSLAVQGKKPKYSTIPFNFDAWSYATGYGALQDFYVEEKSDSAGYWGTWVRLAYQGGPLTGVYSTNNVWRISPALPGTYQVRAKAKWNGTWYESNTVTFTVSLYQGDLNTLPWDERYY